MRRFLATLALIAAFTWSPPVLTADHGNKGNKHQLGNKHGDNDQGWEQKGEYEYRTYSADSRPPGWSQGKKSGEGNCGMPPSQAKSMVAAPTPKRVTLTTTIRIKHGESSQAAND